MPKTTSPADNLKSLLATYGIFGGLLTSAVSFTKLGGQFSDGRYHTLDNVVDLSKAALKEAKTFTKLNRSPLGFLTVGAGVTLYSAHEKLSKASESVNDEPKQLQPSK